MYSVRADGGFIPIRFILTPMNFIDSRHYITTPMNINYPNNGYKINNQYYATTAAGIVPIGCFQTSPVYIPQTKKSKNSKPTVIPEKPKFQNNTTPNEQPKIENHTTPTQKPKIESHFAPTKATKNPKLPANFKKSDHKGHVSSFESFSKSLQSIMSQKSSSVMAATPETSKVTCQSNVSVAKMESTLSPGSSLDVQESIISTDCMSPENLHQLPKNEVISLKGNINFNLIKPPSPCAKQHPFEVAMIKVAEEVAVELKTEIREIISQVDQWMDKSNGRSQTNNINTNETTKAVDLKLLARTLIGEVLGLPNEITNYIGKWHRPPKTITKITLEAIKEFSMIKHGDKVLVCLSGGIDSLSLLHTIKEIKYLMAKEGITFTFGAVTVDPIHSGYNRQPLIPYLKALGVPYFYEQDAKIADELQQCSPLTCSHSSKHMLGRIFTIARENSYNILAFGQHLDALAESYLRSIFYKGFLRTVEVSYTIKDGDLRIIRPFINVRKKDLQEFAESKKLPIISNKCSVCMNKSSENNHIKQMLSQQEILYPNLYFNIRSAMQPLTDFRRTEMKPYNDNYF